MFSLSAPIIGLNVLNVMMLAVDAALCGRLPESEVALAALGFATQVVFLLMVAMLGLIVGTVALVARAYGGKAFDRVNELLVQSTQLTVLVGIVVGIAGALLAEPILLALGASDRVAAVGADYLRPLMAGTPFFYLTLLYAGIFRGVGNTRIPFLCALGANVLNAVLNYTLVLGNLGMPRLGVAGSAIGTVIAQLANLLAMMAVLRGGRIAGLRLALRPRPIDRPLAGQLFRVGWPAALDMLVLNAGFLTALGMLGRIDQVTVAAHGLGLRVQSLAFVPGLGVAQATGAMVGQALGASDAERARRVARASMALCMAMMTVLALAIIAAAPVLVRIFDVHGGTPLERYTVTWMRLLGYAMLPAGLSIALIGVLQGAGATRISLRINIWTTLVVQIPLAWTLGFALELDALGVWLSFPLTFVAKALVTYATYRRGAWAVTGVGLKG
ncbi:MAG TPA: MATE family efflux transporter [Kofleriaceae bacterium]|nr:MATE family efflux transporter [Kofleriaceae bacterium]